MPGAGPGRGGAPPAAPPSPRRRSRAPATPLRGGGARSSPARHDIKAYHKIFDGYRAAAARARAAQRRVAAALPEKSVPKTQKSVPKDMYLSKYVFIQICIHPKKSAASLQSPLASASFHGPGRIAAARRRGGRLVAVFLLTAVSMLARTCTAGSDHDCDYDYDRDRDYQC